MRRPRVLPWSPRHRGPGPAPALGSPASRRFAGTAGRVSAVIAPDLPLLSSGKVRDMYAFGDNILMVASDRISTYDVVHPTPIPDKGKVLTGISVFWFRLDRPDRPQPPAGGRRARADRPARPRPDRQVARDAAGRVRRARLPDRLGLEGLPGRPGAVCGIELPPGLRGVDAPARADLHAGDQGRARRARREHRLRGGVAAVGDRSARPSGCATSRSRCTRRPPPTRRSGGSSSPTPSSSSASTTAGA